MKKNYVNFFIVRDPRDQVISYLNWIRGGGKADYPPWFKTLSYDEQLIHVMQGTTWYNSSHYLADVFLPWINSSSTCVLRFERLVGPGKGNCTAEEHLAELKKIAKALEIKRSDEELLTAYRKSFGWGDTYTPAKTAQWRKVFNRHHKEVFKMLQGDWLIELGYEEDNDW